MRPPFLAATLCLALLASALAGCASPSGPVRRDQVGFPVVSDVNGVSNATGHLSLVGGEGVTVQPGAGNGTLRIGLGPRVRTQGVLEACRANCSERDLPNGTIVAEGSLVTFANLRLNAGGPDADSAVFFYEGGAPDGESLQWADAAGVFELSDSLVAEGDVEARGVVGTVTRLPRQGPGGSDIALHTAALEALQPSITYAVSGRLVNGTANVTLPPAFSVLAGTALLTAQVTLTSRGPPIFVSEKATGYVRVETISSERTDSTFDLLVVAGRAGGERFQAVRQG